MLKLNFIVTEETVRPDKSKENSKTPSGNINNIECSFELPKEYNSLKVNAVFNGIPRPIENGKCIAPYIAAGECVIGVIAYSINEKDEYDLLSSPQPCVLYFPDGSYNENITADAQPSPSELELYYEKVEKLINEKTVIDSALSPDSSNAIANSAVAKVLNNGKLLGFEIISNYADYCSFQEHSSKYTEGLTNGGYVVVLVTEMVYQNDDISDESQLLLAQGTYILKGLDVILQGVGIKVIQELLDDLDTRYLSYDEWKTVYNLLWSSIQLISESHNKLQEDVENELAKKQDREEWTLLINDTLTQDIATGTKYGWSSDINGNAYSVKELFAEIVFPSELSANLALQINGTDTSAIMWGLLPAKTKKVHIHSKMLPDGCIETEYVYKLSTDSEITSHKSLKGINGERRLTAFTKLSISSRAISGSIALPSETAVKIWAMK